MGFTPVMHILEQNMWVSDLLSTKTESETVLIKSLNRYEFQRCNQVKGWTNHVVFILNFYELPFVSTFIVNYMY